MSIHFDTLAIAMRDAAQFNLSHGVTNPATALIDRTFTAAEGPLWPVDLPAQVQHHPETGYAQVGATSGGGTSRCSKCHGPVARWNDVIFVVARRIGNELFILDKVARHFLPVADGQGNVICPGSPSRAQYVGVRETREEYIATPERMAIERPLWIGAFAAVIKDGDEG